MNLGAAIGGGGGTIPPVDDVDVGLGVERDTDDVDNRNEDDDIDAVAFGEVAAVGPDGRGVNADGMLIGVGPQSMCGRSK